MSETERPVLADLRVLVVDDDQDTCELLHMVLTSRGAEVTTVDSAGAALNAFNLVRFDVLLSDAGLPDVTGWSLIETIRRMTPENGGRIPAVAVTGYAYPGDVARSLASGFDAHLSKPVEIDLVVETIARLLGRSGTRTSGA